MARKYNGKTTITKSIYDAVKLLTKGGATAEECANYLKIGKSTVFKIRNSESFEEYKAAAKVAFYGCNKAQMKADAEQKLKEEQRKQEELKRQEKEDAKKRLEEEARKRFEEYKRQQPQVIQVQATHYMMEQLREINENLTLISNKLTFIVEQLQ